MKDFNLDHCKPTSTHYFIRLLDEKGLLSMNLTQNIDDLELKAGMSEDKICQAHGNMRTAACSKCK